jgi:hypothetical protein
MTGVMAMLRSRRLRRKAMRLWLLLGRDLPYFGVHSVELVN